MHFSQNKIEEHIHHESYYFCNIIKNILSNQTSFTRGLNDYYGDGRSFIFDDAFPKWSHFHGFIEFIIDGVYSESLNSYELEERLTAFKARGNFFNSNSNDPVVSFDNLLKSYLLHLNKINSSLYISTKDELESFLVQFYDSHDFKEYKEKTIKEIFYVLFGNRLILKLYNEMIANVREGDWDSIHYSEGVTTKKGYLKRLTIPRWVQKAVYYRDKGRCVLCKKDLTGLINIYNKSNYDHIVPLARFGINDISNIQLLCEECNQHKKAANNQSSNDYFPWY
ncbi:HNH endonuclease [Klebsiella michiganensis]|uniref:HNH endonuclease n=1 Tax=Klebsiella michiganensis TaxID=1134687 RepID=UPI002247D4EF|nr:HNH endonuclease [Klebsiella michiganensis]MCW9508875.1 HNH endonuclease [Klebsiella michiganensis]